MLRPGRQANGGLPSYGGNGSSSSNGESSFGVGYGGGASNGYGGYNGGTSAPHQSRSYENDNKYKRRNSQSNVASLFLNKFVICLVLCLLLLCTTFYYRGSGTRVLKQLGVQSIEDAREQLDSIVQERNEWRKETKRNIQDSRALDDKARRLEEKNKQLEKDAEDLRRKLSQAGGGNNGAAAADSKMSEGHKKTMEHYSKRDTAWRHQVQKLQNATARESKRAALDQFGAGPHRVKVSLHFPDDDEPNPKHFFVVELAPLDIMPHAVHLFLQQVHHKLWDHTWFYLNGPHILQAGPQAYEDEDDPEDEAKLREFSKRQLDTLAFPEYSASYPHVRWTLGFTGRPGGPDWYINKSDNTRTHGPGGQRQHTLMEQADSCFGKVVEGFDILERLGSLPVYHDADYENFFEEPIEILSARMYYGDDKEQPSTKKELEEEEKKAGQQHHHHEPEKKKPVKSHRTDFDDDDILSDEDWEEDWEWEYHDEDHHDHDHDHEDYH